MTVSQSYSMTEIGTISRLARQGPMLPSELAAAAKVTPQTMSQILRRMEKFEIITKKGCESDKRKTYIHLTEKGRVLVENTRYERDEWLQKAIEATLTSTEIQQLESVIPIFQKIINYE